MNRNSKEFKALQRQWDKKLKDSGFEDIEQRKDGNLKLWVSHYFKSKFKDESDVTFQRAKQEYYRRARQFLHEKVFADIRTKRIWELHSEGLSIRSIVATLKKEGHKAYKDLVHPVIKALSTEMKETPSDEQ